MSLPAICAGVAGTPSPGPLGAAGRGGAGCCAKGATPRIAVSTSAAAGLDIDVADLARLGHRPALNAIEVIAHGGASAGRDRLPCWLNLSGVIHRAAHQHRGTAIPIPRHAETRQRFGE